LLKVLTILYVFQKDQTNQFIKQIVTLRLRQVNPLGLPKQQGSKHQGLEVWAHKGP